MNITEAKACKHHDWLFQLLLENVAKSQYTDFCIICMNFELIIAFTYLQLLSGADEVSGEWWQLITAIHDEGDGLMLCDLHTQGYDCTFVLGTIVPFKALLWNFLCDLIDMDLRMGALQAECCVQTSQLWNLLLNVEVVSTVVT
jgi:hypothetical protein